MAGLGRCDTWGHSPQHRGFLKRMATLKLLRAAAGALHGRSDIQALPQLRLCAGNRLSVRQKHAGAWGAAATASLSRLWAQGGPWSVPPQLWRLGTLPCLLAERVHTPLMCTLRRHAPGRQSPGCAPLLLLLMEPVTSFSDSVSISMSCRRPRAARGSRHACMRIPRAGRDVVQRRGPTALEPRLPGLLCRMSVGAPGLRHQPPPPPRAAWLSSRPRMAG